MTRRVGTRARTCHLTVAVIASAIVLIAAGCSAGESPTLSAPSTTPTSVVAATETAQHSRATSPDGSILTEPREASVVTSDGETLAAREFGPSDSTGLVILAHQRGSGKESWYEFAEAVAGEGIRALAVDFRGYGASTGTADTGLEADLVGAVSWAREGGATDIWIVGASMGGTAAIAAAATQDLSGVATLSAPSTFADVDALSVASGVDEPSFILVSSEDEPYTSDAVDLALATGEEEPTLYAGSTHGLDMLEAHREDITFQLLGFFKGTARS